jgi:hypothetical protein
MKPLIITGSAACVHEDISVLGMDCIVADFLAIGLDGVDKYAWPILYVATYHPEKIEMTRERRASIGGNTDYKLICHQQRPGVDICIKDWWSPSGSSALLGVQAGLRMGYKKIILCGCPLTGKNSAGASYENFRQGFNVKKEAIAPFVRSMSGWTCEQLGKPTPEWLSEGL